LFQIAQIFTFFEPKIKQNLELRPFKLKTMSLKNNLDYFLEELKGTQAKLVAVSKTKPIEMLMELYETGWKVFGENKVQEMEEKYESMPKDIEWHLIGTLQTNKIKYIVPFVHLIHSVDRLKVLKEINKQAAKVDRVVDCLLQIHIAEEETKSGFDYTEAEALFKDDSLLQSLPYIRIKGLMGMATNTKDESKVRQEFKGLRQFWERMQSESSAPNVELSELSMGMSGDYQIAVEEGSTLIRVGSAIFGERNYANS
jgi:hypothetical protein